MTGISSAIQPQTMASFLPIIIGKDEYSIDWFKFKRTASDRELLNFTNQVLGAFCNLEKAIRDGKSLDLSPELCHQQLIDLAKYGLIAYNRFFEDEKSRQVIENRMEMMGVEIPAPTFVSDTVPFPWEILYQGENYHNPEPEKFWGFRYTPARILTPDKIMDPKSLHHAVQSDMLFCLHHKLRQAHQQEWPAIQNLLMVIHRSRCCLLGTAKTLTQVQDGETLLKYLNDADHNILHFACIRDKLRYISL